MSIVEDRTTGAGRRPAPSPFRGVTKFDRRVALGLYDRFDRVWNMENHERLALIALLDAVGPDTSIEIGTREGGSLAAIAAHSRKVYTFDIDPLCRESVKPFPNAELTLGPSQETLPGVLRGIEERGEPLEFALIDGDHSEDGVRLDIEPFLRYRPIRPLYILMHDSFNPFCRQGMIEADWASSPHVHRVDLDFVPGKLYHPGEDFLGQDVGSRMWGGFGLAVLRPEPRTGPIELLAPGDHLYRLALRHSVHRWTFFARRRLPRSLARAKKLLGEGPSARLRRLVGGA